MTIKTTIKCDARGCHREAVIGSESDQAVESAGFKIDPIYGEYHYCSKCWPEVEKEITEE